VKRSPWIAGLLSLVIPGLGQIYAGKANKGAVIIFGAVVIANLNIIILPLTAVANPILPGPFTTWPRCGAWPSGSGP
jgi:TM2 domain-containing membrane protein YozV